MNRFKNDVFLIAIHATNALWIGRVFYIYWNNYLNDVNYLADLIITTLLVFCSLLHLIRWQIMFNDTLQATFDSRSGLVIAMRKLTVEAFSRIFYLPGPRPNDVVLEKRAITLIGQDQRLYFKKTSEIFISILQANWLFAGNFMVLSIAITFLCFGGFPSYTKFLQTIPFLVPLLVCVIAGVAV